MWPDTRAENTRLAVPIGVAYTPMKAVQGLPRVEYPPIRCKNSECATVLNPYCRVDFMNKIWVCPFCLTRNHFPPHYADISPDNLPAEVMPQFTTIEYANAPSAAAAPVFLLVVDTAVISDELAALKRSLLQSLMLLPPNALVGLISYGRNVHVYELAFEECLKSFVFRGSKQVDAPRVAALLGLQAGAPDIAAQAGRFLMPVSECEFQLTSLLEDLAADEWPVDNQTRRESCGGVALAVAVGLLEATHRGRSARVMMFMGGPPTVGPGQVADLQLKESIRTHHDLVKGEVPFFNKAVSYYEGVAQRAAANGHAVDLFGCALDEVGVAEMRVCVDRTGGFLVIDDSFTSGVFTGSLAKVFAREEPVAGPDGQMDPSAPRDLAMGFQARVQVLTSKEIKVCGAIGVCTSAEKKSPCVSETEIGLGGTNMWSLGAIYPTSTVAVFLEVANQNAQQLKDGRLGYVQFITSYYHSSGREHLRVTTIARAYADPRTDQGLALMRLNFDQEAAAVLMARYAVHKSEAEFAFDVVRWLDRQLIRLVQKFAQFSPGQPDSFRLAPEFSYYPQFMFHLRRSQFIQVFNSSPDETAFFRVGLLRENVNNSLVMIQPTLMSYSLDSHAQPVLLDVSSVDPQKILLLDTFFNVVVFKGATVYKWEQDGVHLKPEYAYFADFLSAPELDAKALMESRFPCPKYVPCYEGGSQARFLMAKLNPSVTQNTPDYGQVDTQPKVFTDDVSLKVFMEHLRKLAVQPPT